MPGILREITSTEELIRLPAGGSLIITDENGDELFRVTAAGDAVKINGVTVNRAAAEALAGAADPSGSNVFATMADVGGSGLADGFGEADGGEVIRGAAGASGEAGATLVLQAGPGNGEDSGIPTAYVAINGTDGSGRGGDAEIGGGRGQDGQNGGDVYLKPGLGGEGGNPGRIFAENITVASSDPHVADVLWADSSDGYTIKLSQPA